MIFDVVKAGADLATAALRMRGDVQTFLDDAVVKGNRQEARRWEGELRKLNKMIARYGLDQHA